MTSVFPLDLPAATIFYVVLFVATLVIHFVFMSYVLAGTVWILAGQFRRRDESSIITETLSDWMPLMLSGAITAGVAPLLFIQILYRQPFYTANLLQFNRWMAILPVLIVLFYLYYLIKAQGTRHSTIQRLAAVICVCGVLFIAWSWSGNHELSLQDHARWQEFYVGSQTSRNSPLVSLRLVLWTLTTFPVLSCLLTWQLKNAGKKSAQPPGIARTAAVAICATLLSCITAGLLGSQLPDAARTALLSRPGVPWLILAAAGLAIQLTGWVIRFRNRIDTTGTRILVTCGLVLQLAGLMMCRELIRVVRLGDRIDFTGHADARTADGFALFLVFCVINGLAAAWCIRMARSASSP